MKWSERLVASLVFVSNLAACASTPPEIGKAPKRTPAEEVISAWTPECAAMARNFMEEYGQPDTEDPNQLFWLYNGPWARTIVEERSTTMEASCRLSQTVPFDLTVNDAAAAESFDSRITADPLRSELSVDSDSEQTSFLLVNLAHDVVRGRKTVRQARAAFSRIDALSGAGKASPYTSRLLFPFGD